MLAEFLSRFEVTSALENRASMKYEDEEFTTIVRLLGGKTFCDGLYRLYCADQIEEATKTILVLCQEKKAG